MMKIKLKSMLFAVICGFVLLLEAPSGVALTVDEIDELQAVDSSAADEISMIVAKADDDSDSDSEDDDSDSDSDSDDEGDTA